MPYKNAFPALRSKYNQKDVSAPEISTPRPPKRNSEVHDYRDLYQHEEVSIGFPVSVKDVGATAIYDKRYRHLHGTMEWEKTPEERRRWSAITTTGALVLLLSSGWSLWRAFSLMLG